MTYERALRVRSAASTLLKRAEELFGPAVDLGHDGISEVEGLVTSLRALPPPKQLGGDNDRGECASLQHGLNLRDAGTEVIVLCANDGRARRLASSLGIGQRTMASVLREMVRANLIDSQTAAGHFSEMVTVTRLPGSDQPNEGYFD